MPERILTETARLRRVSEMSRSAWSLLEKSRPEGFKDFGYPEAVERLGSPQRVLGVLSELADLDAIEWNGTIFHFNEHFVAIVQSAHDWEAERNRLAQQVDLNDYKVARG